MIKKGRHLIKSHMTLEYDFTGIRVQDSTLTPVDWKVTVDLVATGKRGKKKEEIEYAAGVTYQKIYFWLDTNLQDIIVVDVNNENDLYIANLSTNIMMYCPDNPSDDLLIQLLHAKISALAKPNLMVGEIHLKGSDTSLQYTFDASDDACTLPATTDYYTEGTARDIDPWWTRDDGFCFEFIRPLENTQSDEELFGDITDPMDEFRRIIAESESDSHISVVREPAKIVQVEKWKPKTV